MSYFESDPYREFYNLDGFKSFFITADVDWAPDPIVEDMVQLVHRAGFPITIFATHKSDYLRNGIPNVEVGLHPDNTRPDPVDRFSKKIANLKELFPKSVGLRCHRNMFGNNIGDLAIEAGLKYDVSHLSFLKPYCSGFVDYNKMLRLSYFWEDGMHCDFKLDFKTSTIPYKTPGLKIFNVHPILLFLNAPNDNYRREVTASFKDLTKADYSYLKSRVYSGFGVRNFFEELLNELVQQNANAYLLNHLLTKGDLA